MGWFRRHQTLFRTASILVIVVALLLLMRQLPFDVALGRLRTSVDELGIWAYPAAVIAYVAGALLLVPGAWLTLAIAATFGFAKGLPLVLVSATITAAVGFMLARLAGRGFVEKAVRDSRALAAVETAVAQGGWKVVLLLRLSPMVPFSIANYAYGLTPVRLSRYLLASVLGMIPGTLMYVYLGSLGIDTAAGKADGGTLVLLVVGALATIAAVVYVSLLAKRELHRQTDTLARTNYLSDAPQDENINTMSNDQPNSSPRLQWSTLVLPGVAVLSLVSVACAGPISRAITGLFGPPAVTMVETHATAVDKADFDHGVFDELLRTHVDGDGFVDYAGLMKDRAKLDGYIADLAAAPFDDLGRDEKLALLMNAYNAYMLDLVLQHWPIENVTGDLPSPFDKKRWTLAGEKVSLNDVEHVMIRPNFKEPRIHWAVVSGAFSCPKLRNEAFTGANLEQQLADQTAYVHNGPRYIKYDGGNTIEVTKLYDWYAGD
ncbi:MAG: VTT domain-containing protein, partial [Planctomycetota bacterium]